MAISTYLWHMSIVDVQNCKRCQNFESGDDRRTLQMKILEHMMSTPLKNIENFFDLWPKWPCGANTGGVKIKNAKMSTERN